MPEYALIGDIGGTNARFALTDLDAPQPAVVDEHAYDDGTFGTLREAARDYLANARAKPGQATLAMASPITGDDIRLTNRDWSFNRRELRQALDFERLALINDFAAIAWAAPHLAPEDCTPMHGVPATPPSAPISLIGAGTGLGVALLTGSAEEGWHVVPTEGGHASFAPTNDEERRIAAWLAVRYGGRVSNERALSGDGLISIDAALRGLDPIAAPAEQPGARNAEDITAAALAGNDPDARRALDRFCRIYGAVAGDAALMHGARTVLVAGGMVLHFLDFFLASGFMQGFTAKGRHSDYMDAIAIQVVTHDNPGLLGAAAAARSRYADANA